MNAEDITPEMCFLAMEGAADTESMRCARRFIEATRIIPDWFVEHFTRAERGEYKFAVTHRGSHYERWAKSEADAKNELRYSLYGRVPESSLSPFEVVQFFPGIAETVAAYANRREKKLMSCRPRANSLSLNAVRDRMAKLAS